ncbi:polysaccharide biosynthesis/export family protein [Flavobacterium sp.]|uniref:polysaccharide biosynthesis/export family protein n=1 Tax=Flavobacterium sp. TaxID=239 RepID=UPI002FD8B25A
MNKIAFYGLLFLGILVASCVPTKDLIYLQDKDSSTNKPVISEVNKKPYRIQANDVLIVNIKTIDPTLSEMFTPTNSNTQRVQSEQALYFEGFSVNDHGNIRIPVLGEVNVLGYTLDEVRLNIEQKLLDEYFKKEANLFVSVRLAGLRYTINGEVASPGSKVLYVERVSILDAVANAGDITVTGDRKNVVIVRQYPHGIEMHTVDLTSRDVLSSPYFYLQPNDYILVNPLKEKSWGTGTTGLQSLATIISVLSLVTTLIILIQR